MTSENAILLRFAISCASIHYHYYRQYAMAQGRSTKSHKLARLSAKWKRSPFDWDGDYEYQPGVSLRFSAVSDPGNNDE